MQESKGEGTEGEKKEGNGWKEGREGGTEEGTGERRVPHQLFRGLHCSEYCAGSDIYMLKFINVGCQLLLNKLCSLLNQCLHHISGI